MGAEDRPQCFFDIEINREPVGRIIFQLFSDVCPRTCKNFLCLCTGEKGIGKTTGKKLCYKGSTFHRVVKSFIIQGGDFSEGNGKGGESIYGGYFKDENFILKHDRAFLLSMANRGKHTNGSQFFITTKPAPHLDSVHVVFGLVISGFEVIEQIENLKTDSASRPYADVRVIDCGVLVTKSAKNVLEKKRKAWSHSEASNSSSSSTSSSSESSSDSEYENERTRRRKRKRRNKAKQSRKRRREERKKEETKNKHSHSDRSETNEKSADLSVKRDKPVVRPEEIPPVPENRFLLRRDAPIINTEPDLRPVDSGPASGDQKPSVSKSGRKIRGRGTIRYHTPPHSRSCTESDNNGSSETPPHWKEEMQRLRTYRAPSGEKWSKGDKLSDPGRWDERSLSPRSRSWSHNGFSDLSTAQHVSHRKKHRKEKKVKHKKKAKKQKHLKKHKQMKKKQTPSTELESSPSSTRRKKSLRDQERASRSSSLTSKDDSSRRAWSKSDRDKRSSASLSTRDSRSYYKSRSRTRSRSRSYSQSSQSRNTRMSSQSRSRSRSSSSSKPVKTVSNSPKNVVAHLKECKLVSVEPVRTALPQNDKLTIQPVVAESLPVIPLSDSPPPSRWKPGQKPWKPSYERLQEMKAKTTHLPPAQTSYSLISIKDPGSSSSYPKQQKSSESDRSRYSKIQSNRSSGSWWKYSSRTSRSRSSSKSSSRSRSRSSSRSQSTVRSRSGNPFPSDQSCYSGSSSYFSLSEDDRQKSRTKLGSRERNSELSKKRQSSSESTLPYVKGMSSLKPRSASRSSAESSIDSEKLTPSQPAQEKEQLRSEKVGRKQNKRSLGCNQREEKPRPGQDSNRSKQKVLKEKSETLKSGRKAKTKKCASDEWDSESNSERDGTQDEKENSRLLSAKEEGEASSDSDTDPCPPTKHKSKSEPVPDTSKGNKPPSSSDTETSDSDAGSRDKSRKPKRSSKKSFRKVHGKKAKEKSKNKKEKKHKAEKRKETFHWQPPLEFGEEEEEEEVVAGKPGTKEEREKHAKKEAKDKNKDQDSKSDKTLKDQAKDDRMSHEEPALSKRGANQASSASQLNKCSEEKAISSTPVPNSNKNVSVSKNPTAAQENNKTGPDAMQMDDMEICTPDHNSPVKVNLELSPVSLKLNFQDIKASTSSQVPISTTTRSVRQAVDAKGLTSLQEGSQERDGEKPKASTSVETVVKMEVSENISSSLGDNKWKPLQGAGNLQLTVSASNIVEMKNLPAGSSESKPPGLRIEIKSKNKIRPGSLFDEVRKTARLNQRPRNHESSSEEDSATQEDSQSRSRSRSRSKSDVKSRHRTRSLSYSHSRSQSRSSTYSYRSRSYSRSRSRGWYSRGRSRTRSSSYNSCRSDSHTYSRSRSRSNSYTHRSRSSRSYTYDSYYSRSRSRSRRSDSYHRSRSYDRRSRSYGSDSESDRSYSNCRSPSESSRYS
ncbi:NK-tumor recognition protein isoform X1 [Crotalus tigris]|uniref:NK-tumor recognition protein isoform X1 n=3 Tax=Crotalus tigris TaxID=88082 RepID=UPI00192F8222|nr:NK-tumor recognition protein isoform X1 [Crotalus tigris]XP_039222690.1 NK-tumor recognition protein isoform X1 [Crotalus tigris]